MSSFGVLLLVVSHRALRRQANLPSAGEWWRALHRWERAAYATAACFVVIATAGPAVALGSPLAALAGFAASVAVLWIAAMIHLVWSSATGRPMVVGTTWDGRAFRYTGVRRAG